MQQRLKKYSRSTETMAALASRQITDRSIEVLSAIERYRIIPTSFLLQLAAGNERITYRHLQTLYHQGLINRFAFPGFKNPTEFYYYLDNPRALQVLVDHGHDREDLDWESVRRNREKNYAAILDPSRVDDLQGRILFIKHELMISRFHLILELACRNMAGQVELLDWRQGPKLYNKVEVYKMTFNRELGKWVERDNTEYIPHRPDAFFTLRLKSDPENPRHFFYEADRKTTNTTKFSRKLRGHFHYIVKQRLHKEHYGIERVRAVLVETLDTVWAEELRQAARHEIVSRDNPSPLFWFTSSSLFDHHKEIGEGPQKRKVPYFLLSPEFIFNRVWVTPVDNTPRSLIED